MGQNKAKKALKRKAKKKKRLQVLNRPARPRACGSCLECCVYYPVKSLPGYENEEGGIKPAGTPCMHLTDDKEARCGIYSDPRKPPVCGAYKCMWLWDGEQPQRIFYKDDRPDVSGVIFDLTPKEHPASVALRRPVMVARPTRDGALDSDHARSMYDRFLAKGHVIALVRGDKNYEFLAANPRDAAIVAKVYSELPHFKVVDPNDKS